MTSDYERQNELYFANVREQADLRTLNIHTAIVAAFPERLAYLQDDDAPTGCLETAIDLGDLAWWEEDGPTHVVYREAGIDIWAYRGEESCGLSIPEHVTSIPYDTPEFESRLFAAMLGPQEDGDG